MYALDTMSHLNSVADCKSQLRKTPLRIVNHPEDVRHSPDFAAVRKSLLEEASGKTLLREYFVDSSGLGASDEPAMTFNNFKLEVSRLLAIADERHDRLYSALTGVGQFQVYVSIFTSGSDREAYHVED